MKKLVLFMVLLIALVGCSPSDAQIEAAIEQTQVAQSTVTDVEEPTSTPTIDSSPTPDVAQIEEISYDEIIDLFLSIGIPCGEKEIYDNGSYEQPCDWFIDDALIKAEINGNSIETVSSFVIGYLPLTGEDLSDEIYVTFSEILTRFENGDEMKIWLDNNFQDVLSSEEQRIEYFRQPNFLVTLIGENGFCLLGFKTSSN